MLRARTYLLILGGAVQRWAVVTTARGNSSILANRLEFEGRYGEGLGRVPEAEALPVGDICQHDTSLAPLRMHPNLFNGLCDLDQSHTCSCRGAGSQVRDTLALLVGVETRLAPAGRGGTPGDW